ncbi:hypothetical protein AVEN_97630-1 [Araneus ventricosus]|uniref:Uncharacterized protein n=1 Tax=Araneus ventricosus TaxID=182803 RepID=A0A4Y2GEF1_ARAVE|nr:hypothetical protein AVEN_97630-1 [Araneus ventricosus]
MITDYCWMLQRDNPCKIHKRKSDKRTFEVIRDIMKNVLRMRKDIDEIWRCFDDPMGHPYPKNQVCNVNSFRDIMKNVLLMRKDMAKIWGCFDDPMGQPYIQEPSL